MRAAFFHSKSKLLSWAAAGVFGLGLGILASQMTCAEVTSDWPIDDNPLGDGGTKQPDGDGLWHCYTGTATTEAQFLDHCTEAEHVDRPSNIPATTWDGKSPLP